MMDTLGVWKELESALTSQFAGLVLGLALCSPRLYRLCWVLLERHVWARNVACVDQAKTLRELLEGKDVAAAVNYGELVDEAFRRLSTDGVAVFG